MYEQETDSRYIPRPIWPILIEHIHVRYGMNNCNEAGAIDLSDYDCLISTICVRVLEK